MQVNISNDALGVPDDIIYDLIKENPDAGVINITDYGVAEQSPELPEIEPAAVYYGEVTTTTKVTTPERLVKDEFKFSVAKGEEVTLSKTYEGSLTGNVTGIPFKKASIGASITIKATYEKGTTYNGPSENSIYNSREFRMKFYEEVGEYTQTRMSYLVFEGRIIAEEEQTTSGTYNKPTRYLSYSIDKMVS